MDFQYGLVLVMVLMLVWLFIAISQRKAESERAALDSLKQAEHDEQTRAMAKRLADTGTQWRLEKDEAISNCDNDDEIDQSVEAQFGRFS